MADAFQLRVVTLNRLLLDEEVHEVSAPGALGEFGVLPDHITFLGALEIGTLRYRADRGPVCLAVRGGFAEVVDNVMTVLADDAAFGADIDQATAQHDLQTAEAALKEHSPLEDAYATADADRRWAIARLEAARAAH
jgi:F-type H+-transporting ATPase subunit epsilon